MTLNLLFLAISLSLWFQPNPARLYTVMVYSASLFLHDACLSHTIGLVYYGSAALFDLAVIILTGTLVPVPALLVRVHQVCLASILLNFYGWVIWRAGVPPVSYDVAFVGLYTWAVYACFKQDPDDTRGFTSAAWRSCIRRYSWPRVYYTSRRED